jgi:putative ABC transport system substrate-binding protein
VKAAQQATNTIPIVMIASDPVGTGFVASLAQPGGNITGLSLQSTDLTAKRLELMREIVPSYSSAMVLWDVDDPPAALALKETEEAARRFGITLATAGIKRADDIDGAFAATAGQSPQVLIMLSSPVLFNNVERIALLAGQSRLPSIGILPENARRGLLMSYGPNYFDVVRRSATYVDKILKGARPADLPVEQPTQYELTINLKTAKALGLSIPTRLLSLADELIE